MLVVSGVRFVNFFFFVTNVKFSDCKTSPAGIFLYISDFYKFDMKASQCNVLANILLNKLCKQITLTSQKEPSQKMLKLALSIFIKINLLNQDDISLRTLSDKDIVYCSSYSLIICSVEIDCLCGNLSSVYRLCQSYEIALVKITMTFHSRA